MTEEAIGIIVLLGLAAIYLLIRASMLEARLQRCRTLMLALLFSGEKMANETAPACGNLPYHQAWLITANNAHTQIQSGDV